MFLRIASLSVICLAVIGYDSAAQKPPAKEAVTVIHDIRYREGPNKQWRLDLAMKKDPRGKPRPGIVVIHGGGWLEGDRSSFASRKYGVPGNIEDLAALGFVAVTVNYRLSGEAPFPAALEDCQCAVRWLRAHATDYNLDPKHIGAYGNSAGGHLALLLGMVGTEKISPGGKASLSGDRKGAAAPSLPYGEQSSLVQAVVSDSGPLDLLYQSRHGSLTKVVRQFLGGPPTGDRVALYKRASPIHHITSNTPPLLLIYGGADDQVPIETADQFVLALDRAGVKDVTYHRLAYVYHCPYSLVRLPWLRPVVNEFFLRTLRHPETSRQIQRKSQ